MLKIKNRAILDQWKMLTMVKGWSTIEATEYFPVDPGDVNIDWMRQLIESIVDKSVEISEKRLRPFGVLLDELKSKASGLFEEWNNIKVESIK